MCRSDLEVQGKELTTGEMISSLHKKSHESSAFTNEALLKLAKELLANFGETEQEWSTAGDWVAQELNTLKLHPESKPLEEMDDYAYMQAAQIRATFSSAVKAYLVSTIASLEDQMKKEEKISSIDLINKKRTVETFEGSVEVHGPASLPMIPGLSFETWSKPSNVDYEGFKEKAKQGVCLVLGAGNQPILSAVDCLHCIFVLRCPLLLKHHPLRAHLIHPYTIVFKQLLDHGLMKQILDPGLPRTKELLSNESITHIHITGAYQTVAAIQKTLVEVRKDVKTIKDAAAMITSELGCATPFIFPPAVYTEKELRNAAKAFVTSKKYNGGSNCLCGQVIVMSKEWSQNQRFREILLEEFETTQKDPIYYPGSLQKRDSALSAYSSSSSSNHGNEDKVGKRRSSVLSAAPTIDLEAPEDDDIVLVECGTPGEDDFNGYSLTEEAFGPVVAIVELPGGKEEDPVKYMQETVAPFVNDKEKLFGTLSCTLLWPASISAQSKKPQSDEGLLQAIACLQYGCIAINSWSLFGYLAALTGGTWGGHPRDNLRHSGSGAVGNQFGLPIEKTVVYGAPLTNAPLVDKKNLPPAIVHDVIHAVIIAPSMIGAMFNVWLVLAARSIQFFLPKFMTRWIFGERKYGAAL
ncbi:unnamed protein product [Cylindrotheca closterium]|uniref:Aldehyde dehydrogenase domain-containing protein n=1 Tax=Cylindrotheca closterium TaxID=2856 RepID=A0AAD2CP31_9STRA|nr:unnamed protein product [Cylindrotheca closterium]